MLDFLKFPRKIRDTIYEYCLVVDGYINPYNEFFGYDDYEEYKGDIPGISLLFLNKIIHQESTSIL